MINPFKRKRKPQFSKEQTAEIRRIAWQVVNEATEPDCEIETEEDGAK